MTTRSAKPTGEIYLVIFLLFIGFWGWLCLQKPVYLDTLLATDLESPSMQRIYSHFLDLLKYTGFTNDVYSFNWSAISQHLNSDSIFLATSWLGFRISTWGIYYLLSLPLTYASWKAGTEEQSRHDDMFIKKSQETLDLIRNLRRLCILCSLVCSVLPISEALFFSLLSLTLCALLTFPATLYRGY